MFESDEGPTHGWINIHDNGDTLWLDFYIDDEDDNTFDNGNSLEITKEELELLTFYPDYENFHEFRELVEGLNEFDMPAIIKLANEKLASK